MKNFKDIFVKNFINLGSWEEKYLYLIELGLKLEKMPKIFYQDKYKIWGCQSQVWIVVSTINKNKIKFYGDSDSSIVKGFIYLVFLFYKDLTFKEILKFDIYYYINKIDLEKYISYSRSQGLESIIIRLRNIASKQSKIIKTKK